MTANGNAPKTKDRKENAAASSSGMPLFPFHDLKIIGLGGRMYGPTPSPWIWKSNLPHFNFWFLIRGEGRLRYRGRDYRLEPGTCFLFAPGMRISGKSISNEPFLNFSVHFFPEPRRRIPEDALHRLFGRKAHRMAFFLELARHCTETYKRGDTLGLAQAKLAALQMMYQLWREACTPVPREGDERILQLLASAGRGGATSVPDLARQVGLSASQFTRRVRAITGIAPREYLIQERIGHACGLLAETSRSVAEVAEILGYVDPSYFVRQFQIVMKTTPARFRRQAAGVAR